MMDNETQSLVSTSAFFAGDLVKVVTKDNKEITGIYKGGYYPSKYSTSVIFVIEDDNSKIIEIPNSWISHMCNKD